MTQGASAGGVVEALLDASCAPVPDRRRQIGRAVQALTSIPGVVSAQYLDAADEQDAGCLIDLAPDPSVTVRRFVRPREDLTPASAAQLAPGAARVFLGFPDTGFGTRWGALVLGLDDVGVRRVSQFDRLHPLASVVGWVCRAARLAPTSSSDASEEGPEAPSETGPFVDVVPHGVVVHLSPTEPPIVNRAALGWAEAWHGDHGVSATAWDGRRFTEFGALDRAAVSMVADASTAEHAHERARAAFADVDPPIDDDEWAVVDQVLLGRRLSTAARELRMGERRARASLRGVLVRLDRAKQAELAILLHRSASPA